MMTDSSWDAFKKTVQHRRSIRIFAPTPVPDNVIRECFEMAILSPSSSNLQPWQFYRLPHPDAEVCKIFLNQSAAKTAPEVVVAVARPDLWEASNSKILARLTALGSTKPPHFDHLTHYHSRLVPFGNDRGFLGFRGLLRFLVITVLGWVSPVMREGYFARPLRERAIKGTSLACQTFMLALSAKGYDSCPMEGFDSSRLRKYLKLPRSATIVMGIAVGKANPAYTPPLRIRFDYKDAVVEPS